MPESTGAVTPFGDRIDGLVRSRRSQLVLGLDPLPEGLWPASDGFEAKGGEPAAVVAARVADHCRQVIEAVASECVGVKLQLACFERLGAPGRKALSEATMAAHAAGLFVIADGKRGDIDVSAASYAASLVGETETELGRVSGLGADAVTVNALMGADTVQPFIAVAREHGAGLFVLVRTSNPGAADIQDLELAQGGTVSEAIARLVDGLAEVGESGLSDVGAVVGATVPGQVASLRRLMPRTPFLLPGVGAQGGKVEDLAPAFEPGPAGGLVTVSRAIVGAAGASAGGHAAAAAAEAARLRELAWEISGAV